jgi:hypothetical protein
MTKLIMFARNALCNDQALARHCLREWNIKPTELNISIDQDAAQTLVEWIGSLSVPTLVAADEHDQPIDLPRPLAPGERTRNADRGSIISEPSREALQSFLQKHGFVNAYDQSSNN